MSSCTKACHDALPTDPDLSRVVSAWSELPDAIKAGILAMVSAADPTGP
ncbi:hypothetical protein [Thalassoroseus pseudoceratinae]|nr:hypothetical protein [Thalassoroseus pseudoceratinae]